MNKVLPAKLDYIADFARRGFERIGLELLGVVPMETMLAEPTLLETCEQIRGTFLCNEQLARTRSRQVVIGALSSANLFNAISPGTLLVVPGDREDVVLAALSKSGASSPLAGMVLSDDLKPHERLLEMLSRFQLPVILSPMDSYSIAQRIHSMTVKTLPGDTQKIGCIQDLISQYVSIPRLLEKIQSPAAA
jgi:BioD-like phosphotransacetylase family protein